MPLQAPRYFKSKPIAKQVLLLMRRPDEPKPEPENEPAIEAPADGGGGTDAPEPEETVTA